VNHTPEAVSQAVFVSYSFTSWHLRRVNTRWTCSRERRRLGIKRL
jgi:hypothetical protein